MKNYKTISSALLAMAGAVQMATAQSPEQPAEPAIPVAPAQEAKKDLGLELGSRLPKVDIITQHGVKVPLAAPAYHRYVFVFFYPKAMSPG